MLNRNVSLLFSIIVSLVLAGCASINNEYQQTIYAIYDKNKVGEMAMISAIAKEIKISHPEICVVEKPNAKIQDLDLKDVSSIVTAGQFGIALVNSSIPQHVKALLCVHQWFDAMKTLHNISIAIPKHTIDENVQRIAQQNHLALIPTVGVLHTMAGDVLEKEDVSSIRLCSAKVGIVLGGDAELPNGSWKVFSVRNVKKLAEEIAEFQKQTGFKLLITNSPRTGRSLSAHRNGKIDFVSKAFLKVLKDKGLEKGKDFEFFDFQFGKPSRLKAIIKTVWKNKGFMVVPGESTSSISEVLAVMPATIYRNDAMNPSHEIFVDQLINQHIAQLWPMTPSQEFMESYKAPERQEVAVVKSFLADIANDK